MLIYLCVCACLYIYACFIVCTYACEKERMINLMGKRKWEREKKNKFEYLYTWFSSYAYMCLCMYNNQIVYVYVLRTYENKEILIVRKMRRRKILCVCMCVCICACVFMRVWQRETEWQRTFFNDIHFFYKILLCVSLELFRINAFKSTNLLRRSAEMFSAWIWSPSARNLMFCYLVRFWKVKWTEIFQHPFLCYFSFLRAAARHLEIGI